jgi:Ran-binding protein 1
MSESQVDHEHDHEHDHDEVENPDPHFEPIISLPPVQTKTLEEDEEELVKLRAKLFRYDAESEPREWKERGTGDVKILRHNQLGTCRVLMRRDKTLKICANHYVLPYLELKPNCGSDRAWVWSTPSDFADEEPKPELLAIRFANAENAQKFQEAFDKAKKLMAERLETAGRTEKVAESAEEKTAAGSDATEDKKPDEKPSTEAADKVAEELKKLSVEPKSAGDSAAPTVEPTAS